MLIEKALQKMREAATGKTGQHPVLPSGHAERRPSRESRGKPQGPKPTFPQVEFDQRVAQNNRVLISSANRVSSRDGLAEAAYRMLRTRLLQQMRGNNWTTLAFTSPGAGEGKSLTALNLALSIAKDKSCEVFLMDLDMRNPSLFNYLGARPERELVQYFAGEGAPADVWFSIGVDNLAIAGSTRNTYQASELLATGKLEELLTYVNSIAANPVILIDLPPLLVTDEALLIAPRVDATVLVVAEGRTRRDGLDRAKQLLAEFTFAGVILNRSTERFGADSYYGYGYKGEPGTDTAAHTR